MEIKEKILKFLLGEKYYAHCLICGERLSEWFIKEGKMWCFSSHGTISPYRNHAEYRSTHKNN